MVYLIKVGQKTRKQLFMKLLEKVVSVSDKHTYADVMRYFSGMYDGFEVEIETLHEVDISGDLNKLPPRPADDFDKEAGVYRGASCIKNFDVQLTPSEKKLHQEYRDAKSRMESIKNTLCNSIQGRFRALSYSNLGYYNSLELEIEYNGVTCLNFPIRGQLFEDVAKKAEDIPCIEIPAEEPDIDHLPEIKNAAIQNDDLSLGEPTSMVSTESKSVVGGDQLDDIPF